MIVLEFYSKFLINANSLFVIILADNGKSLSHKYNLGKIVEYF
jgi:hypothetical protein